MRCSLTSLLGLIPLALALDTTSVTFTVPTNHLPQNGNALPPNTHVTLSTLHKSYSTPLTTANTFVFRNVTPGSYLVDTHCTTHAFAPLRLDVSDELTLAVWETYRGNDWDNKGEVVAGAEAKRFELRVLGGKNYFVERPKFSVLGILKNPMILLGLVSMGIFIGMPYLMDNMDPEMKAEFEERQKSSTMNSLLSGQAAGQSPMGNFDMAAYLAGSSKKESPRNGGGKKDAGAVKR